MFDISPKTFKMLLLSFEEAKHPRLISLELHSPSSLCHSLAPLSSVFTFFEFYNLIFLSLPLKICLPRILQQYVKYFSIWDFTFSHHLCAFSSLILNFVRNMKLWH